MNILKWAERMLGWPVKKEVVDYGRASSDLVQQCAVQGQKLEATFTELLKAHGDTQGNALLQNLDRPFCMVHTDNSELIPRSVLQAHCYAIALTIGLDSVYASPSPYLDTFIDWTVCRFVAAEEVGPANVGHAPNSFPESGGHVSFRAGSFVGGKDSQQLTLLKKYRALRSNAAILSMISVVLGLVLSQEGVEIQVLRESWREGNTVGYHHAGYRDPTEEEIVEWSSNLVITNSAAVLAGLPKPMRNGMLEAINSVNVAWPPHFIV